MHPNNAVNHDLPGSKVEFFKKKYYLCMITGTKINLNQKISIYHAKRKDIKISYLPQITKNSAKNH